MMTRKSSLLSGVARAMLACLVVGYLASGSCYVSYNHDDCHHSGHSHSDDHCDHHHRTPGEDAETIARTPKELFELLKFELVLEATEDPPGRLRGFRVSAGPRLDIVVPDPVDEPSALRVFGERILSANAGLFGLDPSGPFEPVASRHTIDQSTLTFATQKRTRGVTELRKTRLYFTAAGTLTAVELMPVTARH